MRVPGAVRRAESVLMHCKKEIPLLIIEVLVCSGYRIIKCFKDEMLLFFPVMTLPGTVIDPSTVRSYQIFSITSNSFEMSWHVSSTLSHTFQVQVFRDKDIVQNLKTEEMKIDVFGLEAGVMYSVWISYETCGKTIIFRQNVKTGKQPLKKRYIYFLPLSLPTSFFPHSLAVHQ